MSSFDLTECPRSYHLNIIQQPQKTAEFANASLSRLPLTPPMVVQLKVTDLNGNSIVPEEELTFLVAHLSLFTEDGIASLDMGCISTHLYGSLVVSVDQLEDLNGNMGLFFIFPDVSIRWKLTFRKAQEIQLNRLYSGERLVRRW
ncbi:velvet factor-domain-containing protein [Mycena olivaceomarginata]|nr:velvet factor-domain-containing protein [Mycena olivaceomarginata]